MIQQSTQPSAADKIAVSTQMARLRERKRFAEKLDEVTAAVATQGAPTAVRALIASVAEHNIAMRDIDASDRKARANLIADPAKPAAKKPAKKPQPAKPAAKPAAKAVKATAKKKAKK